MLEERIQAAQAMIFEEKRKEEKGSTIGICRAETVGSGLSIESAEKPYWKFSIRAMKARVIVDKRSGSL